MKLTKHEHACMVAQNDGTSIVIDPGSFSADAAQIIAGADVILITHEHFDHVNEPAINAALADRPDLMVYAPDALRGTFATHPGQFTAVAAGDELKLGSFNVTVHGSEHAVIHADIPVCANVGFLLNSTVYHPGDAYFVPDVPVTTLLLPTSGPWMKFGEAIDYVRAVQPQQVVQIHEMLLSDIGLHLAGSLLGEEGPTRLPLTAIPAGQSLTI
ncbi:MAG TPA: MBL fold metallo-hydrolase [Streptosporangiaceae bacterium]|jgi:L-ascorbate metabolism protein UlaG (beta-lactamase superfamily)